MNEQDLGTYEWVLCPDYCNDGIIITCCDDMCAGQDHCIHGDGEAICPTCEGEGWVLPGRKAKNGKRRFLRR